MMKWADGGSCDLSGLLGVAARLHASRLLSLSVETKKQTRIMVVKYLPKVEDEGDKR